APHVQLHLDELAGTTSGFVSDHHRANLSCHHQEWPQDQGRAWLELLRDRRAGHHGRTGCPPASSPEVPRWLELHLDASTKRVNRIAAGPKLALRFLGPPRCKHINFGVVGQSSVCEYGPGW